MTNIVAAKPMNYNPAMARPRSLKNAVRRNVLIEGSLWRKLMDEAKKQERSASYLIRKALQKYLGE